MNIVISEQKQDRIKQLKHEIDSQYDNPEGYRMDYHDLSRQLQEMDFDYVVDLGKALFGVSFETIVINRILNEPREAVVKALSKLDCFSNIRYIDHTDEDNIPF